MYRHLIPELQLVEYNLFKLKYFVEIFVNSLNFSAVLEDPWRTTSPKHENVASPDVPPIPNLPGKSNDPWAPVAASQPSTGSPDEDEFAAISNRNASSHRSGERKIMLCFRFLLQTKFYFSFYCRNVYESRNIRFNIVGEWFIAIWRQ